LTVTTACAVKMPAVIFDEPDCLANFHILSL
jgi:hypothetical protein